jgi:hypothetical protein
VCLPVCLLSEEFELYALGFYGLPFLFPPCLSQGFVLSWVFEFELFVCLYLRFEGAEFGSGVCGHLMSELHGVLL